MPYNLADNYIAMENDMRDFKMPYTLHGKLDEEVMIERYKSLSNRSRGLLVRYTSNLW